MFYKCLRCGKVLQGLGLRTHLSRKEKLNINDIFCKERLSFSGCHWNPREYDYFCKEELVAVCIGNYDPQWAAQVPEQINRLVTTAKDYWKEHKEELKDIG
jgi:hypothetical protein